MVTGIYASGSAIPHPYPPHNIIPAKIHVSTHMVNEFIHTRTRMVINTQPATEKLEYIILLKSYILNYSRIDINNYNIVTKSSLTNSIIVIDILDIYIYECVFCSNNEDMYC